MNISSLLSFNAKVTCAYHNMCRPILKEFDISQTSFDIIMFLNNNPDHYTAKEISTFKNIKPNVVSLHVDKLVNDGYLMRQHVEGDRRKIRLSCTDKAADIIMKGRETQRAFLNRLSEGISYEDIQIFKRCFDSIEHNVDVITITR